jgi:hypothetical protein
VEQLALETLEERLGEGIVTVTSEVRMWSAIDQPTTFLEQMSITVAR